AVLGEAMVGHESLVALDKDSFEFVPFDPVRALPAPGEIGRLVDAVVEWTGESKVLCQRLLHALAVVRLIGGKDRADQVLPVSHRPLLRPERATRVPLSRRPGLH